MDVRAFRRAALLTSLGGLALGLGACGDAPVTGRATGRGACAEFRPSESGCANVPSFARDVKPILTKSCVPCHYGALDPDAIWPLTDYGDVAAWNDLIKTSLLNCSQPPAASVFPFSTEDRVTVLTWTLCNHPP